MEVSINDLSFKGQFKSNDDAKACLLNIANLSYMSKKLTGNMPVRRTKNLASRLLTEDKTINDFRMELYESKKPEDQKLLSIILANIVQGPFIKEDELNKELKDLKSNCNESISGSSLHAYLSKDVESINALISAENTVAYDDHILKFELPNNKYITVLNFF